MNSWQDIVNLAGTESKLHKGYQLGLLDATKISQDTETKRRVVTDAELAIEKLLEHEYLIALVESPTGSPFPSTVPGLHTDFGIEVLTGPQLFAKDPTHTIRHYMDAYRERLRPIGKEISPDVEELFKEGNMEFILNLWWTTQEYQKWARSVGKDMKRICLLKRPFSDSSERYLKPDVGKNDYGDAYLRAEDGFWANGKHMRYPRGTEEEEKQLPTPLVVNANGYPTFFVSAPHHPQYALGMFHAGCFPKGDHDKHPNATEQRFQGVTNIVMKFAAFPRNRTAE